MDFLKLSENIVRLRHEKGVTQGDLADFLGVTKASVSKWETRQTYPDILLLPKLASYFQISVDRLLGYEPQLSKTQIRAVYQGFAEAFAERPFEEVMKESEEMMKKYYSCYPLLLQICVLWLNHNMLAEKEERRGEILEQTAVLCGHILKNCQDVQICNEAADICALVELQRGNPKKVIEEMEGRAGIRGKNSPETLLAQAYLMQGDTEKAEETIQAALYQNVMEAVSALIWLAKLHGNEWERISQIMERADRVLEVFRMEELNPNTAAAYQYETAILLCGHGRREEAFARLNACVRAAKHLIQEGIVLHGDSFFDRMDHWFDRLDLGADGVRNRKLILDTLVEMLDHPAFAIFTEPKQQKQMEQWRRELEEMRDADYTKSDKDL